VADEDKQALTGVKPKMRRMKNGKIEYYREHLDGFAELADAVERWLEETGR